MRRRVSLGLLLAACRGTEPTPDDSDSDATVDEPFDGCDYSAFAGDWSGMLDDRSVGETYPVEIAVGTTAELLAPIATGAYPSLSCTTTYPCLGVRQVDWYVSQERVTSGGCIDVYAFFRPETDGTLTFEVAFGELEDRIATAVLTKAE